MAVKRMATLRFLGSLTMLLLGALVYLAATGGRPERQPVPQLEGGWSCCEPGPGRVVESEVGAQFPLGSPHVGVGFQVYLLVLQSVL